MFPTLSRAIIAPTGGEQMQMGVVLSGASMGVEDYNIAPFERLTFDGAVEIIEALHPAAHEGAQDDRGILVEDRTEHRGDREDDVTIDHPRVQHFADLTDPVIRIDLGTPQAHR